MKRPDIFSLTEVVISSAFGIIGGAIAQNYVSSIQEWLYFGLAFLIVSVLILILHQYLTNFFRNRMTFVRKWSKNYIEGQWVQMIEDNRLEKMPPTKFSFLNISWENGNYHITGRSYDDAEGMQTTNFYSLAAEYEYTSNTLNYVYKFTTDEGHNKKTLFGESKLVFGHYGNTKHLNKYKGEVHSNLRDGVRVLAIKNPDNQNFNFSNPTSRQKVISTIREAFLC